MSLTPDALADDQVLAHPGFFCGFPQGEHLVISLIPPVDEFAEGAAPRVEADRRPDAGTGWTSARLG